MTPPSHPADRALAPGTAGSGRTRVELLRLRPELVARYDTALPQARAQVLARLWGALAREPLPGVAGRARHGDTLRVALTAGGTVDGDAGAAEPFAVVAAGHTVRLSGGGGPPVDHRDPGTLLRALRLPGHTERLAAELDNSVANLALAHAAAADRRSTRPGAAVPPGGEAVLQAAAGDPDGPGRLEQLVTDGHPLHPCCRTRGAMSVADVLAYAPEHRPVLRLHRYRVPPQRWYGTAPPVLLAHPWQAHRLRDAYPWLVPDGETGPMRPLMSLRTMAPLDGGDHVKTAVQVQLTSAVRTVSPAAVHNGPRLSALLQDLTADLPTLRVLAETSAGAVILDDGPARHLAHLRRQAPPVGAGHTVVPLAALAARSPVDGRPLLAEVVDAHGGDPYAWFTALTAVLVAPLLTVLGRGVALEAHGQNTLLVLAAGRPQGILYRDLGGVRVGAARLRAASVAPPALHGDLPTDDPQVLRTKLGAALVGAALGEQVALLSRGHDAEPDRLWSIAAAAVRGSGANPADIAALLGEPLPVKATTAMRLADDPLHDRWALLGNPMAAHR